jgi:hypothetical protein
MFQSINNWTKTTIIQHIKDNFKGKASLLNEDGSERGYTYKTKDGKKCAVGLFIPEDHRNSSDFFNCVDYSYELLRKFPELNTFMPLDSDALRIFQIKHDEIDIIKNSTVQAQTNILINWIESNVQ